MWPTWRRQEREITIRADELLERFNLAHMRDEYAGSLSGGQRKLLEMARALMTEPSLIMLDEPMAGVNPALKQVLNQHIKTLRDEGMTVLFVEHDMDMVHDISDWVVVMAEGRIIAEGRPDDIAANPAVIDAYLGAHQGESLLEGEIDDGFGEALDAGLTLEGGMGTALDDDARVDEGRAFIFADRKEEILSESDDEDRTHG
jgi:branched-chain amino acid transport system ATP-binding protein